MKLFQKTFFVLVLWSFSLAMTSVAQNPAKSSTDAQYEYMKQSERFQIVLRDLMMYYVDTISADKIVRPAIETMLNTLDPYTSYFTDAQVEDFDALTSGKYGGFGALIGKRGDKIRVIEPYEKSPAGKVGLRPGDILLKINGQVLDTLSVDKVATLLRGSVGSSIDLEYKKIRTGDTLQVKVKREMIQIPAVPYYGLIRGTKIGYIAFDNFSQNCSNEIKAAIQNMNKLGMSSLILDLRSNAGGLVDEAVRIANFFLPQNVEITNLKGRLRTYDFVYKTKDKPIAPNLPLAILINKSSASSSEILAGALQDYDRAVLLGGNTYGKGLIQTVLDQPYEAKLKITTAKYYIPSGRCIQLLDYKNKNKDGGAEAIPDSLRMPFKTSKGRTVYDGGGIFPDIPFPDHFYSSIGMSLFAQGYMEDFGVNYQITHDSLPNPEKEDLPKTILADFEKFLEGKDYSYQTESQHRLTQLIEAAKREKYYDSLSPILDSLKSSLFHDKKQEFELHKEDIFSLLEGIIYSDYQFKQGRYKLMLRKDPIVSKAREVLSDMKLYESFFEENRVIK